MAARYYGVVIGGDQAADVTDSASTTSRAIELVISNTTATGINKLQVIRAIQALEDFISTDTWPPA
jgi:hypothetical protein